VYAALLAAASPMLHLTGALALPDAPLTAAYAAGTWLLARARGRRWAWAWAGVAVGVALVSKYSAALLAPALFLLVAWDRELRGELRTRWPWLGAAIAVAIFLPTLLWDARQGFPSIGFQLHHGFRGEATLRTFGEFVGAQIASAGPVPLAIGIAALARARDSAWRRVAAATLLPVAVPFYSSMTGVPEVNWAVHAFPGLAAATGAWLAGRRAGPALVGGSVGLAAVAIGGFVFVQANPSFASASAYQRFHGWKELTRGLKAEAEALCRAVEPPCDPADPFVLPSTYRLAPIAFYSGWTRLGGDVGRPTQLDLWDERPRPDEAILLLAPKHWDAQFVSERHRLVPLAPERRVVVPIDGGEILREALLAATRR
jgi:hypothetical protein